MKTRYIGFIPLFVAGLAIGGCSSSADRAADRAQGGAATGQMDSGTKREPASKMDDSTTPPSRPDGTMQ